jgi:hypothetical protein
MIDEAAARDGSSTSKKFELTDQHIEIRRGEMSVDVMFDILWESRNDEWFVSALMLHSLAWGMTVDVVMWCDVRLRVM